jgi:hypothetical protein
MKRVKEGKYTWGTFLYKYDYGTLKPVKDLKEKELEKREKKGGEEPNWGTIYLYLEMSQQNSLCKYHLLIETFF